MNLTNPNTSIDSLTSITVRGGQRHLKKRGLSTYPKRHQIIAATWASSVVAVHLTEFQVEVGKGGIIEKFNPEKNNYDYRKRKSVWLYNRFVNYMSTR